MPQVKSIFKTAKLSWDVPNIGGGSSRELAHIAREINNQVNREKKMFDKAVRMEPSGIGSIVKNNK